MRHIGLDEETIAGTQALRLPVHLGFEGSRHDVRDLPVRVMVDGANGALPKVDANHHQVRAVA